MSYDAAKWPVTVVVAFVIGIVTVLLSKWISPALLTGAGILMWFLVERKRLSGFVEQIGVLLAGVALYGIYLAPPQLPQLMAYRVIQPVYILLLSGFRRLRMTRPEEALLLLFVLYSIARILYNSFETGFRFEHWRTVYDIVSSLLLPLGMVALREQKNEIRSVVLGLLLFWAANVGVGLVEVLLGIHLPFSHPSRYSQSLLKVPLGFLFNHNNYAAMLVLLVPFWLYMRGAGPIRGFRTAAVALTVALVVTAGSIVSTVSLGLVLTVWLVSMWRASAIRISPLAILVMMTMLVLTVPQSHLYKKLLHRWAAAPFLMDSTRADIYLRSVELLSGHPFGLSPSAVANDLPSNPHSLWLEIGLYFGWPGLILFVAINVVLFYRILQAKHCDDDWWQYVGKATFTSLLAAGLIVNGPSTVFTAGFSVFWVLWGLAFALPITKGGGLRT